MNGTIDAEWLAVANKTDDNWERVQEIFLAAADLPEAERAAFLAAACLDDSELKAEVESLLRADTTAGEALTEAIESEASLLLDGSLLVGQRLGAYRIIREIGRGGMGAVYLAERDDDQYHKQVAIKVVKRGMDTADLLRRFRTERQILANLDHPYIAHLLDGGSSPDGRPFLVMEFIEGKPIDRYCQERNLGIQDRLKLFLRVCEAAAYAHRNLVVHCDLKPGNILIAGDGSPKLLDFGVAKLVHADMENGLTRTLGSGRLLTPDYASPEQLRGAAPTTAMDVYALGGVLYQLLTGVKPHRIQSSSPGEWERVICDTEITRPSAAVADSIGGRDRWRRQLEGDLDNVVLMAMRKEAARRYPSVDHFAEDIRRYLDCRTVVARSDSLRYRTAKFLRRHRYAVAAAALVVTSLVGGSLIAVSQARRAVAARRVAETERQTADRERLRAVNQTREAQAARQAAEDEHRRAEQERDLAIAERLRAQSEEQRAEGRLTQMVDLANRSLSGAYTRLERLAGAGPARRHLVSTTLDFLEKLSRDAGNDQRLRTTLGMAYLRLGDIQGDINGADPNADPAAALKSYRAGSALVEQAPHGRPASTALSTWFELQQKIGTQLAEAGDRAGAIAVFRRALSEGANLSNSPGPNKDALRSHANLYLFFSRAVMRFDIPQGLEYANQYLEAIAALTNQFPSDPDIKADLSSAHLQVGWVLIALDDLEAAATHYEKVVELREELVKAHPKDAAYRRSLMMAYQHLGGLQGSPLISNLGHQEIARHYYAKARVLFEEAYAADPEYIKFYYADFQLREAALDVPPDRLAESLAALRKVGVLMESLSATGPAVTTYVRELGIVHDYIGQRLVAMGKYAEALPEYRRSLAIIEEIRHKYPVDRAILQQSLHAERGMISALMLSGDHAGSVEHARALIDRAEAGLRDGIDRASGESQLGEAYMTMASVRRTFREWAEARTAARQAVSHLSPLVSSRGRDPNARMLHETEQLLAECELNLSASR